MRDTASSVFILISTPMAAIRDGESHVCKRLASYQIEIYSPLHTFRAETNLYLA
jgi:hypothetical protein